MTQTICIHATVHHKTSNFSYTMTFINFSYIFIDSVKPYIFTRLPVTRWVKLSLNFELLVPK